MMKGRKYIYLNNLNPDGAVFQTQILDWLNLYEVNGVTFRLIQAFHVKELGRPGFLKNQITFLRKCSKVYAGTIFLLPSKGVLYILNSIIIYCKLFRYLLHRQEILVFSRALLGREIILLRLLSRATLVFYYDARAASAEENKYSAINDSNFTLRKYRTIANIHFLEYKTLTAANRIFAVSHVLKRYFIQSYQIPDSKFVYYPCLSDARKFYYSPEARMEVRKELQIADNSIVFIYSGGISNKWHISNKTFGFFQELIKNDERVIVLCLTKDIKEVEHSVAAFPKLKSNLIIRYVSNLEVYRYLNGADFGVLFRENTTMNNVASPTKYAEYMLCGLPVLISDGVGDYSDFTARNRVGIVINEDALNNCELFDFTRLLAQNFDRSSIADIGRKYFSKDSLIDTLVHKLRY